MCVHPVGVSLLANAPSRSFPRSTDHFRAPLIVPTLRVGMPARTLCVHLDAERQPLRYHAERGNNQGTTGACAAPTATRLFAPLRHFPDERHLPVVNLTPFKRSVDHCARGAPGHEAPVFSGLSWRAVAFFSGCSALLVAADQAFVRRMRPDRPAFLFIFVEDHPCLYLVPFLLLFHLLSRRARDAVCSAPACWEAC
ncbi:hypothetical protein SAMN03159444_01160 [Pseudomonas sp. NFACC02]|nr:hypothetical protein SAMN03159444_01160 [Pseudomonas sp. NFACC02]